MDENRGHRRPHLAELMADIETKSNNIASAVAQLKELFSELNLNEVNE